MSPSQRTVSELDDLAATTPDAGYTPGQGLPLDLPFVTDQPGASAQVSRPRGRRGGTDTPHPASPELARVSRRRLDQLAAHMPERDHHVLRHLAEHRYLTTHQIERFVCTGHASPASAARTARYLTRRLSKTGLIRALGRRIGGSKPGSTATIWQLAPAGARLVRESDEHYRTYDPSPRFLRHCLTVADVDLALRHLGRFELESGSEQAIEVRSEPTVHVETEPDCWRRYTGLGGEPRWLQPDLFARITSPDYIDRWFIEVDLGTESLPALVRKCQIYQDYYASGTEQAAHGGFPLVLWVFTDPDRVERLRRQVLRHRSLTTEMFRFTHISGVTALLEASS